MDKERWSWVRTFCWITGHFVIAVGLGIIAKLMGDNAVEHYVLTLILYALILTGLSFSFYLFTLPDSDSTEKKHLDERKNWVDITYYLLGVLGVVLGGVLALIDLEIPLTRFTQEFTNSQVEITNRFDKRLSKHELEIEKQFNLFSEVLKPKKTESKQTKVTSKDQTSPSIATINEMFTTTCNLAKRNNVSVASTDICFASTLVSLHYDNYNFEAELKEAVTTLLTLVALPLNRVTSFIGSFTRDAKQILKIDKSNRDAFFFFYLPLMIMSSLSLKLTISIIQLITTAKT